MNFSIHQVPGRIRVRSACVKAEPTLTLLTLQHLRQWPGVSQADANRLSGSLTIHFDRQRIDSVCLLDFLSERGFFPPVHRSTPTGHEFRCMNVSVSGTRFNVRRILALAAREVAQNYAVGFLFALF